jgi:hypothetical protein
MRAMTLLITLANKSVVHQSSDYCISDWSGNVVETVNGAKQLSVSAEHWTARVVFTGIAFDSKGYRTLDWLETEGLSLDRKARPEEFIGQLARRGSDELKRVRADRRKLTLVVTFVEGGRCRLFLVSNFEQPGKDQLGAPLDALRWFDLDLSDPLVLVSGAPGALPRHEKRCLERLFRSSTDPQALRDRMAAANRVAAGRPGYKKLISEGCWVFSLFADGKSYACNFGEVPGIPGQVIPEFDIGAFIRENYHAAPGQQIKIRQMASVRFVMTGPQPAPIGEPREVRFSAPTTSVHGIGQDAGAAFPQLVFEGRSGMVTPRKNEQVTAVLGTVTLEIDPSQGDKGGVVALERLKLLNAPTLDIAQLPTWSYTYEFRGGGGAYTLHLCQMSAALRADHSTGPSFLGPNEELVLAAPVGGLTLQATPQEPRVTGEVVASFLIRDFQN